MHVYYTMKQMHQQSDIGGFGDLVHFYLRPSQVNYTECEWLFHYGKASLMLDYKRFPGGSG